MKNHRLHYIGKQALIDTSLGRLEPGKKFTVTEDEARIWLSEAEHRARVGKPQMFEIYNAKDERLGSFIEPAKPEAAKPKPPKPPKPKVVKKEPVPKTFEKSEKFKPDKTPEPELVLLDPEKPDTLDKED